MTMRSSPLPRSADMCPLVLAGAALLAAPFAASLAHAQQVYKWSDEKGVVNYTTTAPSQRKFAVVDVAPAVAGQGVLMDSGEARYWRARHQREAASEMTLERMRRDTEALRQTKLRQEMVAAETAARQPSATQRAIDQCRSERRVDCDSPATSTHPGGGGYATSSLVANPQFIIVNRSTVTPAPAGPYFSTTPHFTPGYSIPQIYSNPR